MRRHGYLVGAAVSAAAAALLGWSASRPADILFERQMIDGDGKLDIGEH